MFFKHVIIVNISGSYVSVFYHSFYDAPPPPNSVLPHRAGKVIWNEYKKITVRTFFFFFRAIIYSLLVVAFPRHLTFQKKKINKSSKLYIRDLWIPIFFACILSLAFRPCMYNGRESVDQRQFEQIKASIYCLQSITCVRRHMEHLCAGVSCVLRDNLSITSYRGGRRRSSDS